MKRLLEATATMGLAAVIAILIKMVGAKVVASALGPSGVGTYAQLVLVADLGTALSSLGLSTGIIRYASEFRSGEGWHKLRSLESTVLLIVLPFSLLVAAIVALLSPKVSGLLLGEASYAPAVAIVALGLPLAAVAGIADTLINAAKRFRLRAITVSSVAAVGLVLLVPLVTLLNVLGASIALAATCAFEAAVAWFFALRLDPRRSLAGRLSPGYFDSSLLANVFQYGIASLASTAMMYASALLVRTAIVTQLGISANGLYQVVWASQTSWLPVLFSGFYSYFYPSYCEAKDLPGRCEQMNRTIRFMILLSTPFLGVYTLFRSEVVWALYTADFLPAAPLLGISLLYGPVSVLAYCLTLPLLGSGKLWALVALNLVQRAVFVVGSFSLLPVFELSGVIYATGLAAVCGALAGLVYARRALGIGLSAANGKAFVLSIALVVAVYGLSDLPRAIGLPAALALLLVWAYVVLDRSEVQTLRHFAYGVLDRTEPARR